MTVILFLFAAMLFVVGIFSYIRTIRNSEFESISFHNIRTLLGSSGSLFVVSSIALFTLWSSLVTVSTGARGVVLRFKQVTGTVLEPGIHIINPFTQEVREIVVQTRVAKFDEDAASKNLQMVHTQVTLGYYNDPKEVPYILQQLNDDAENRVIIPAIQEGIKAVTALYDVEELISKRGEVRNAIEGFVRVRLLAHHILVDSVSITDFKFSDSFEKSIEAKQTAQQEALKAENDLNRIKVEATQRIARAEAEAQELRLQKSQISPELIQLRAIEKWDGHLPVYVGAGTPVAMLDVLKAGKEGVR